MGIDLFIMPPQGIYQFTADEASALKQLLAPIEPGPEMYPLPENYAYRIRKTDTTPAYPKQLPAFRCRVGRIVSYHSSPTSVDEALEWIEFIKIDDEQSEREADTLLSELQTIVRGDDASWLRVGALPVCE